MFSIRRQLLFAIGTVAMIGTIGIEVIGYVGVPQLRIEGAREVVRAEALRRLDKLADERRNHLERWLSERQQDLDAIGENPAVATLATHLADQIALIRARGEPDPRYWQQYLQTPEYRALAGQVSAVQRSRSATYAVIGIRDAESGQILASSRGDRAIGQGSLRGNPQFESARTPGQFKFVDLFVSPLDQVKYLRMTQQIYSRDELDNPIELKAIAQFLLPLSALPVLPGSDAYASEDIYLVGSEGKPITPPRFFSAEQRAGGVDRFHVDDRAAQLAGAGSGGLMRDVDYRGKTVLVAYRHIAVSPDIGWGLIVKQDEDEALRPLYDELNVRLRLVVLWMLVTLLVVWVIARRFAAPITHLAAVAGAIERGQLSARSGLVRTDEIGALAHTIDQMAEQTEAWHRNLSAEVETRTRQLRRVNQLYRTLSEANQAILREETRERLLDRICEITVRHGGFDAAWITLGKGATDDDRERYAHWQAREGRDAQSIEKIESPCRDGECLPPPNTTVVVSEIASDPRVAGCRTRMIALGWHSFVAVPIRGDEEIAGTLRVAAREADAVDSEAVALLEELATDVAFALRTLQRENRRIDAEATVAVQEARLRAILASTVDAVISVDNRGLVEYWNPAAETLFGYRADETIGDSLHSLILPSDEVAQADRGLDHYGKTGQGPIIGRTVERNARHRDGTLLPVELAVAAFKKGDAWHAVGVVRDIRERKRIEAELKRHREHLEALVAERTRQADERSQSLTEALERLHRLQHQLIQSEKLSGLGALVAGVAHELNTPIGNARLVASSMVEVTDHFEGRLQDAAGIRRSELVDYARRSREAQELVERNLIRASEIIQSFKQVAVDQASSNRRQFDLGRVIEEVLTTVRPVFKHSPIELQSELQNGVQIDGYPGPLGQVIVNLLDNARVHGFEGRDRGTVRLRAAALDGGRFVLSIADDGVGIAGANLPRIFDPFFTTRLGQGGSGLGLSIVYNIVTGLLGGSIDVRSTLGQGTEFIMTLPCTAPTTAVTDGEAFSLGRNRSESLR